MGISTKMGPQPDDSDISLIRGGPFYRVQEFVKLIRPQRWDSDRRVIFACAVGWLPLLLMTALVDSGSSMSFLKDYRIHSRMLIAVPILLLGQSLMDSRFRTVVSHIRETRLLAGEDHARFEQFIRSVRRLRDSIIPELLLFLVVVIHTAMSYSGQVANTPWLAKQVGNGAELTPAGWYAVLVSAPIFQFLLGLSVWKWLLWTLVAFRLSRLHMNLNSTHADTHGGLGFLGLTPIGFTPIAFAVTVVIGATWRHEILLKNAHLIDFKLPSIVLVIIIGVTALLPLAFFVPCLAKLRREGMLEYSQLGQHKSVAFHQHWIKNRAEDGNDILDSGESSDLYDFNSIYDRIRQLKPFPIDRGALIALALSVLIPVVPTILAEVPIGVVLKELLKALR